MDLDAARAGPRPGELRPLCAPDGRTAGQNGLYGDISAIVLVRTAIPTASGRSCSSEWHPRLLNGSDYPPGVLPIVRAAPAPDVPRPTPSPTSKASGNTIRCSSTWRVKRLLRNREGKTFPVSVFETRGAYFRFEQLSPSGESMNNTCRRRLVPLAIAWSAMLGATSTSPVRFLESSVASGDLGLYSAADFRLATGRCTDCPAEKQALWYFGDDVVAVSKGAGFSSAARSGRCTEWWRSGYRKQPSNVRRRSGLARRRRLRVGGGRRWADMAHARWFVTAFALVAGIEANRSCSTSSRRYFAGVPWRCEAVARAIILSPAPCGRRISHSNPGLRATFWPSETLSLVRVDQGGRSFAGVPGAVWQKKGARR